MGVLRKRASNSVGVMDSTLKNLQLIQICLQARGHTHVARMEFRSQLSLS